MTLTLINLKARAVNLFSVRCAIDLKKKIMGKLSSFLLGSLVISPCTEAQVKQGTVVYERKLNMYKNLSKEDDRIKNVLPEFSVSKQKLLFSGDESISSNMEEVADIISTAGEEGDNRMRIRLTQPDVEYYKNYKLGKTVELRELGPRKYIIEDTKSREALNFRLPSRMLVLLARSRQAARASPCLREG